jgi:hypothetical protein
MALRVGRHHYLASALLPRSRQEGLNRLLQCCCRHVDVASPVADAADTAALPARSGYTLFKISGFSSTVTVGGADTHCCKRVWRQAIVRKWISCVNGFYLTERHSAPSARHRQRARGWIQYRSCSIVVVVVMVVVVVVACGVVRVGVVVACVVVLVGVVVACGLVRVGVVVACGVVLVGVVAGFIACR